MEKSKIPDVGDTVTYHIGDKGSGRPAIVMERGGTDEWPVLSLQVIDPRYPVRPGAVRHEDDPWFNRNPHIKNTDGFFSVRESALHKNHESRIVALEEKVDKIIAAAQRARGDK